LFVGEFAVYINTYIMIVITCEKSLTT